MKPPADNNVFPGLKQDGGSVQARAVTASRRRGDSVVMCGQVHFASAGHILRTIPSADGFATGARSVSPKEVSVLAFHPLVGAVTIALARCARLAVHRQRVVRHYVRRYGRSCIAGDPPLSLFARGIDEIVQPRIDDSCFPARYAFET
jgi:hypothetical protein